MRKKTIIKLNFSGLPLSNINSFITLPASFRVEKGKIILIIPEIKKFILNLK